MEDVEEFGPETPQVTAPALRHRPLIPVLCGFAVGIALDAALRPPSGLWAGVCAAAVLLVLWGVRRGLEDWGHWLLAILLLVPLGGFWHAVRFRQTPAWHLRNLDAESSGLYHVRGKVTREPELHYRTTPFAPEDQPPGRFWLLRVKAESLSGDGRNWRRAAGGVAVFGEGRTPAVNVGDTVQLLARLAANQAPTNPGERDRALSYDRAGSHASASVPSADAIAVHGRARWYSSPSAALGRLRTALSERLREDLQKQGAAGRSGLIEALLFGRRGALTPSEADLLTESGTLHFLAISGLHVGMFCLFVSGFLRLVGVPARLRLLLTIVLIWAYVLFTGGHTSATRAGWMLTFLLGAPLLQRRGHPLSALCAAALVILAASPQKLFSAGFQLTFVAVWGIITVYPQLHGILWPWSDLLPRLRHVAERTVLSDLWLLGRSYLLLSCTVWAIAAPLTAYHFNVISVVAPILNLVVWPLVLALLLTCFALGASLMLGGLLAGPIARVALFWAGAVEAFLRGTARLPGFGTYLAAPPRWWIGLFFVVVALWVFKWRVRGRHRTFIAAVLVLALAWIGHDAAVSMPRCFRLTVADVAQGQALLVEVPTGEVVLFDAGSRRRRREAAVADMLWDRRIKRISAVVVSHLNSDHYGFIPFLHRRFPVQKLILPARTELAPDARQAAKVLRSSCKEARRLFEDGELTAGELHCLVLHPNLRFLSESGLSDNEKSLVLRCSYRELTFLVTGDIKSSALRRLLRDHGDELMADVLVMPHHGRYHPELGQLIERVRPAVAIVSGEADDCDPRTRAVLRERTVPLWATADDGAVVLRFDGAVARVHGHKSRRSMQFRPSGSLGASRVRQVAERSGDD